jgi:hypothetical protein
MNKYFVKYIRIEGAKKTELTRFFNTSDIEKSWISFSALNSNPNRKLQLVDITYLGKTYDFQ